MDALPGPVPAALAAALADRYRIERELGAGGMATVYLAHDLKHERQVAIKVLRPELATALGADRFLREIQIAANLQHPHIVPLLDSGQAAEFLFYVMPFVRGESLREKLLRERELPVHEAARILRDVTDALAHAHASGVVHRDIKPENVMLSGRHALVTDFGVAKALSEASGRQSLTTVGVSLGTPAYMAPEQAAADPLTDHRADIYAVGVLAYEMLTGSPPFGGDSAHAILSAHLTQAPAPVTQHRALPPALAELVMKCLQKRPADRWQSVDEMVPHFEAALTPGGGLTPTGRRMGAAMPAGGYRRLVAAAVALLALLAGGWGVRQYRGRTAPLTAAGAPRAIAVLPFENVGGDSANEAYADGISDDIRTALGKIGLRAAARSSSYAFKGRRVDPKVIGSKLHVGSYVTGTFRRAGSELKVTAELINVADGTSTWSDSYLGSVTDIFRVQDSIATAVAGAMKVRLGTGGLTSFGAPGTTNLEAHDLYQQAVFFHSKFTQRDLRRAIDLYERAGVRDPKYAAPLAGQALAWVNIADDWLPPREAYPKAKLAVRRALAIDESNVDAHVANGLVRVFYDWDFAGAEREFLRAMALDSTTALSRAGALGFVLHYRGLVDSTVAIKQRAVDADPLLPLLRWDLARDLINANRLDSAESVARGLRELDAHYTSLPFALGMIRMRRGQYAEALREIQQGDSTMGWAISMTAMSEAALGRRDAALRHIAAMQAARRTRYMDGAFIARAYASLGDRDAAFRWLDTAFVDRSAQMGQLYDFGFDPIRSDPRFRALEERVRTSAGKP